MEFKPSRLKENAIDAKNRLKDKFKEVKRVLKITEKPDREEFVMSAKITGIGMIIIGLIGFLFYLASNVLG
ncbi:MAG: protein translocase SEC61 complex subunit gamma [Candidatus Nanosalina sp.]